MIQTKLKVADNTLTVERVQDVEDILENAKGLAKQPNPKGDHVWHKWSLPNVMIERFYNKYNLGRAVSLPMDDEFWKWVDKQVMSDPDYLHFRTVNKSRPFIVGYDK